MLQVYTANLDRSINLFKLKKSEGYICLPDYVLFSPFYGGSFYSLFYLLIKIQVLWFLLKALFMPVINKFGVINIL